MAARRAGAAAGNAGHRVSQHRHGERIRRSRGHRANALLVTADGFLTSRRNLIVALAGGLLSYGTSSRDSARQVGLYAARILKGAKPADLPIIQASTFELVLNLRTAKKLGVRIPPAFLARTDEVIE